MSVTADAQAGHIFGSTCATEILFVAGWKRRSVREDGSCAGVASISGVNRYVADATH